MRHDPAREVQRQVRDVFDLVLHAGDPARAHRRGDLTEDVNQDRHVVWRQVPDDVERRVEQSEADAHGIDVVHLAELATPH
jgi:hypothetical protein